MNDFVAVPVSKNVYWVGAIDWELRNFHGYNTTRGTTYNSFLIMGEKPILIDTVKAPFFDEMMARIKSVIDPEKISYLVSNHAEMDHSGCMPRVIDAIKPEQIFASKMGIAALHEHFDFEQNITEINNGEKIQLGDAEIVCLETRMLHWPESMFTFYANDGILFSQDGFGMHFATSNLFADQHDRSILRHEAAKYYANILLPYSQMVTNLLAEVPSLNLDIKMIAPDHGPLWRNSEDITWILQLWKKWAQQKPSQKAVIVYDTMWNSTAKMARTIADSLAGNNIELKVMPISGSHRSDIATEILEAGALLIGSPTINKQMFPTVAEVLCYLKGLNRKNLIGQVFGSYGWGGEAVSLMQAELTQMQVKLVGETVNVKYVPNADDLNKCRQLGNIIAQQLNLAT